MPFDQVIRLGAMGDACMYEVDARGVHGVDAARQLLSRVRERVRAGRALRPDAAHYVNVATSDTVDEDLRTELIAQLGNGDGIDSVAVFGRTEPGARTSEQIQQDVLEQHRKMARTELGGGWPRVVEAMENDTPLVGTVLSASAEEIRVDIDGAVGLLREWKGGSLPTPGDTVRMRVIVLNVGQRRLELMPVSP